MSLDLKNCFNEVKYEYSDGKDRVFISYQKKSFRNSLIVPGMGLGCV